MSTHDRLLHPGHLSPSHSPTPLLFVFLIPMLAVVGMILWLASGPTWTLVALAIAAVVVMLVLVLLAIGRLLNEDDGKD